jgi:hypothetical protein
MFTINLYDSQSKLVATYHPQHATDIIHVSAETTYVLTGTFKDLTLQICEIEPIMGNNSTITCNLYHPDAKEITSENSYIMTNTTPNGHQTITGKNETTYDPLTKTTIVYAIPQNIVAKETGEMIVT